jgi:anti-anti-sigma factor
MTHRKLEFRCDRRDDRTLVYTASGDLYGSRGGYDLQDEIRRQVGDGANDVILDLAAVESIDSSGVGILVTMMWSASNAGSRFVVVALSKKVSEVLGIAMLLDHIDHADSIDEALEKLGRGT